MMELKTLRPVPVPDPSSSPSMTLRLIGLVRQMLKANASTVVEREIEEVVADLYGISVAERHVLGMDI